MARDDDDLSLDASGRAMALTLIAASMTLAAGISAAVLTSALVGLAALTLALIAALRLVTLEPHPEHRVHWALASTLSGLGFLVGLFIVLGTMTA